jgi:hypothetical protein
MDPPRAIIDALEVIQTCNGEVDINNPYAAILAKCFQKASEMEEIVFLHCHRKLIKWRMNWQNLLIPLERTGFGRVIHLILFCSL